MSWRHVPGCKAEVDPHILSEVRLPSYQMINPRMVDTTYKGAGRIYRGDRVQLRGHRGAGCRGVIVAMTTLEKASVWSATLPVLLFIKWDGTPRLHNKKYAQMCERVFMDPQCTAVMLDDALEIGSPDLHGEGVWFMCKLCAKIRRRDDMAWIRQPESRCGHAFCGDCAYELWCDSDGLMQCAGYKSCGGVFQVQDLPSALANALFPQHNVSEKEAEDEHGDRLDQGQMAQHEDEGGEQGGDQENQEGEEEGKTETTENENDNPSQYIYDDGPKPNLKRRYRKKELLATNTRKRYVQLVLENGHYFPFTIITGKTWEEFLIFCFEKLEEHHWESLLGAPQEKGPNNRWSDQEFQIQKVYLTKLPSNWKLVEGEDINPNIEDGQQIKSFKEIEGERKKIRSLLLISYKNLDHSNNENQENEKKNKSENNMVNKVKNNATMSNFIDPIIPPNVQPKHSLLNLVDEYSNRQLREKAFGLASYYNQWRRIRGDGNCYYRALAFGAIESFVRIGDIQSLEQIITKLKQVNLDESMVDHRKHHLDLIAFLMDILNDLINIKEGYEKLIDENNNLDWRNFIKQTDKLNEKFENTIINENSIDAAMVRACRNLIMMYLLDNKDELANDDFTFHQLVTIVSGMDWDKYLLSEVMAMGKEAEGFLLDIGILPLVLGIRSRTVIFDRDHDNIEFVDRPDDLDLPHVHLFFKPGHYDLLYPHRRDELEIWGIIPVKRKKYSRLRYEDQLENKMSSMMKSEGKLNEDDMVIVEKDLDEDYNPFNTILDDEKDKDDWKSNHPSDEKHLYTQKQGLYSNKKAKSFEYNQKSKRNNKKSTSFEYRDQFSHIPDLDDDVDDDDKDGFVTLHVK